MFWWGEDFAAIMFVGRLAIGAKWGCFMNADDAIELMNRLMWTTIIVSGPVLAGALIVGLLVSIFQVTTQLQEMTLSYIPKLLAAAILLIAIGPWMLHRIGQFAISLFKMIP